MHAHGYTYPLLPQHLSSLLSASLFHTSAAVLSEGRCLDSVLHIIIRSEAEAFHLKRRRVCVPTHATFAPLFLQLQWPPTSNACSLDGFTCSFLAASMAAFTERFANSIIVEANERVVLTEPLDESCAANRKLSSAVQEQATALRWVVGHVRCGVCI